jgi:hypothetical protein
MGHCCRICGDTKPNEKFSGKGHRNHICKECSRKPKEEIQSIEQSEEIFNFLTQSNISKKNISRLKQLACSENAKISEHASIVLDVARVKPRKKQRLKFLAKKNKSLLLKLKKTGLIVAHEL